MTTVLIVDDHQLVREAIRELLGEEPWIAIVGEAIDGETAICLALRHRRVFANRSKFRRRVPAPPVGERSALEARVAPPSLRGNVGVVSRRGRRVSGEADDRAAL